MLVKPLASRTCVCLLFARAVHYTVFARRLFLRQHKESMDQVYQMSRV
jgi:hypothetical protein